jgi:DNA mismatch repair protein MutL
MEHRISSRIKQLPSQEAQKIAAGEVVERPANIVKELFENSLDAQATEVSLFVKDGGRQMIRVVDNGYGMSELDAHACFEHHATSKISSIDDLAGLKTFGFRGEALSSISAVSKITLITKQEEDAFGYKVRREGTIVSETTAVASSTGTDIMVDQLFFNVPVRKKFLKSKDTEWRHILTLFQSFCLAHRAVQFKLFSEHNLVLNCPAVTGIVERIAQVWDYSFAQRMLTVLAEQNGVTITGCISDHTFFRYDRSHIFLFVNNRWIKNTKLSNALLKGYLNVLPPGRYPAAALFITVPADQVDINVHPRKEEVQFLHPRRVESMVTALVKKRLEEHIAHSIGKKTFSSAPSLEAVNAAQAPLPYPFSDDVPDVSAPTLSSMIPSLQPRKMPETVVPAPRSEIVMVPIAQPEQVKHAPVQQRVLSGQNEFFEQESVEEIADYQIIGQYRKTYIVLEKEDGLFLVDQHAAHERILYEQFGKRFDQVPTVDLLFPQIITLTSDDMAEIVPHLALFRAQGIILEPFGDTQIIIQATPVHAKNIAFDQLIQEVLGWIYQHKHIDHIQFTQKIHEHVRAQMACKAAVKAGDVLTLPQMTELLSDLCKTKHCFTCPHGRPTGWLLPISEIEKKFKRKL